MKLRRLPGRRFLRYSLKAVYFVALSAMLLAPFLGIFFFVIFIQFGMDFSYSENLLTAQATFWTMVWFTVFLVTLRYFLRKRPAVTLLRWTAKSISIIIPLVLMVGGAVSIGAGMSFYNEASAKCNIVDTLTTARSATYSINTDIGSGTGFAINDSGLILTNHHVVEGGSEIYTWVNNGNESDYSKERLEIASVLPEYDLATLKLDRKTPNYLKLVDSTDEIIEEVYSVGFPGNTFSEGYVSMSRGIVSRDIKPSDHYDLPNNMKLLQTDAAINPGNSGGPLVNKCGAIGVTTAISGSDTVYGLAREEGIGYAISSSTVNEALNLK